MRKIILGILISFLIIGLSSSAGAGRVIPPSEKVKEKEVNNLNPYGLEKKIFIHYKKGFAKSNSIRKGVKCYDFLGKNIKWNELPVNYIIDPRNHQNLNEDFIINAIYQAAEEWDSKTGTELFDDNYQIAYDATFDTYQPDGRNEILFGNYPQEGVIGITVVWGYFSGPVNSRKIIEFDTMFDTDYVWGDATLNSEVMDLQNIATHELGHAIGLDDVYDTSCSEVTMYGYSDYGEIKKRDLAYPDITGLQKLYGR